MDELQPGLLHWTAHRATIGADVHSAYHLPTGTLIDPMVPLGGLEAIERHGRPQRIVLTSARHYRDADRFRAAFGCPVLCHEAALDAGESGRDVEGYAFGDELAPGITALEVGVPSPGETALHIRAGEGALTLADAVVRGRHGELGFPPDELLGEDPDAVRAGVRAALARICEQRAFDTLVLAHAEPIVHGARSALWTFARAPTAGGPPG